MNQTEENLRGNHTTPMVSEFHTKQPFIEENSSLFMNSIWYKGKTKVETSNLITQEYSQEPQRICIFMNSILAFVFVTIFQQNQNNFSNTKMQNIY
jgi:hypothetical protein